MVVRTVVTKIGGGVRFKTLPVLVFNWTRYVKKKKLFCRCHLFYFYFYFNRTRLNEVPYGRFNRPMFYL